MLKITPCLARELRLFLTAVNCVNCDRCLQQTVTLNDRKGWPKCNTFINVNSWSPAFNPSSSRGDTCLSGLHTAQEERYCTLYLGLMCPDVPPPRYPVQPKQILPLSGRAGYSAISPYTSHSGYFLLTQCLALPHSICLLLWLSSVFSPPRPFVRYSSLFLPLARAVKSIWQNVMLRGCLHHWMIDGV